MKKRTLVITLAITLFLTGCSNEIVDNENSDIFDNSQGTSKEIVFEESFVIFNPYGAIQESILEDIGADGFNGTDEEIANQILKWQADNMQYIGDPNVKEDISYPMRWNYMIPGIFPVENMLKERVLETGKIYGLCWDYAAIYSAIASSYGLEVRVTALKKYLSDINSEIDKSSKEGLSVEEYDILNKKLLEAGVDYSYSQVDRVARETWVHYRAEVKINDTWVSMDGVTIVTGEYKNGNFEVATWDEGYNNIYLNAPSILNDNVVDIESLVTLLKYAPFEGYIGTIDDAGNIERASTFKDLTRGRGLLPYYEKTIDVSNFLKLPIAQADEILDDIDEIFTEYENGTGKKFYMLADFLLYADKDEEFEYSTEDYVRLYNGLTGSKMTETEFSKYVK